MMRTSVVTITLALLTAAAPALTQDTDASPPLGRLVDLAGRRLHLNCSGSAAPTATSTPLGDMPVVVLTRGFDASPDQQTAHAAIAELSRNSRHTAVPGSYHEIHFSHPGAVIAAILDVVSAVRERRPLR